MQCQKQMQEGWKVNWCNAMLKMDARIKMHIFWWPCHHSYNQEVQGTSHSYIQTPRAAFPCNGRPQCSWAPTRDHKRSTTLPTPYYLTSPILHTKSSGFDRKSALLKASMNERTDEMQKTLAESTRQFDKLELQMLQAMNHHINTAMESPGASLDAKLEK